MAPTAKSAMTKMVANVGFDTAPPDVGGCDQYEMDRIYKIDKMLI